jgi:hypothetical protein
MTMAIASDVSNDHAPPSPPAGQHPAAEDQKPVSVIAIESVAELERYLADWDDLAAAAVEPNVFYESWMLRPALRLLAGADKVVVVLVFVRAPHRDKGKPLLCGLFPLVRRHRYCGLPIPVVSCWRYLHCFLGVPLVRAGHAQQCFQGLFDWLATDRRGAALFEACDLTGEGPFWQQFLEYLDEKNLKPQVTACHTRALLRPRASASEYLQTVLSGDRRKKLRKAEAQLARTGPLEYVELAADGDPEAWLKDFLRLEESGWKGHEGTALNANPVEREFFLEVARAAFARQRLMLLGLCCNRVPVAMLCNFHAGDGSFAFKVAFDEAFARSSPGVLLELENIRRVHERPALRWMDSCSAPGPALVKALWADRRVIQTVLIDTGRRGTGFLLAVLPLLRWFRRRVGALVGWFRRSQRKPATPVASTDPPPPTN